MCTRLPTIYFLFENISKDLPIPTCKLSVNCFIEDIKLGPPVQLFFKKWEKSLCVSHICMSRKGQFALLGTNSWSLKRSALWSEWMRARWWIEASENFSRQAGLQIARSRYSLRVSCLHVNFGPTNPKKINPELWNQLAKHGHIPVCLLELPCLLWLLKISLKSPIKTQGSEVLKCSRFRLCQRLALQEWTRLPYMAVMRLTRLLLFRIFKWICWVWFSNISMSNNHSTKFKYLMRNQSPQNLWVGESNLRNAGVRRKSADPTFHEDQNA